MSVICYLNTCTLISITNLKSMHVLLGLYIGLIMSNQRKCLEPCKVSLRILPETFLVD